MDYENVSEELREKARACKTPEEILALAKEEGYKLSDEEVRGIAGGGVWSTCDSPYYCNADGGCYGRTR